MCGEGGIGLVICISGDDGGIGLVICISGDDGGIGLVICISGDAFVTFDTISSITLDISIALRLAGLSEEEEEEERLRESITDFRTALLN